MGSNRSQGISGLADDFCTRLLFGQWKSIKGVQLVQLLFTGGQHLSFQIRVVFIETPCRYVINTHMLFFICLLERDVPIHILSHSSIHTPRTKHTEGLREDTLNSNGNKENKVEAGRTFNPKVPSDACFSAGLYHINPHNEHHQLKTKVSNSQDYVRHCSTQSPFSFITSTLSSYRDPSDLIYPH